MFKEIKTINSIKSFSIYEDVLILINSEFKLFNNGKFISEKVLDSGYTFFDNRNIYLSEIYTYINNTKFKDLSYIKGSEDLNSNTIIFAGDFKLTYPDFSNNYYIHELESDEQKLLFNYRNLFNLYRNHNNLFLTNKKEIHFYIIPTTQTQWQFNTEQLGNYLPLYEQEQKPFEVAKFLGVWQDQLLVACKGGLIISLKIQDGSLQKKWQELLPKDTDVFMLEAFKGVLHQSGLAYQLNNAQDKIIALYYRHLIEIDFPSGVLKVTDLTQELQKQDISVFQHKSGYAEDDTHYYTTIALDRRKLSLSYIPTALCAINKETLVIDWLYRFDQDDKGDSVSVQVPQVSGNKLYQLTQNNVLHIFEKQENSI